MTAADYVYFTGVALCSFGVGLRIFRPDRHLPGGTLFVVGMYAVGFSAMMTTFNIVTAVIALLCFVIGIGAFTRAVLHDRRRRETEHAVAAHRQGQDDGVAPEEAGD